MTIKVTDKGVEHIKDAGRKEGWRIKKEQDKLQEEAKKRKENEK